MGLCSWEAGTAREPSIASMPSTARYCARSFVPFGTTIVMHAPPRDPAPASACPPCACGPAAVLAALDRRRKRAALRAGALLRSPRTKPVPGRRTGGLQTRHDYPHSLIDTGPHAQRNSGGRPLISRRSEILGPHKQHALGHPGSPGSPTSDAAWQMRSITGRSPLLGRARRGERRIRTAPYGGPP